MPLTFVILKYSVSLKIHASIQCRGNQIRFLKEEHIIRLVWQGDNLPWSFQAKNVKLFTNNLWHRCVFEVSQVTLNVF